MRKVSAALLVAMTTSVPTLPAFSATPFAAIAASPDITVDLAGTTTRDEDVAEDDFVTAIPTIGPPGIPANADLVAYHQAGSDALFSLDTTVSLPGGLTVEPRDVVRWDGVSYTLEFDGSAEGISNGARVDAISVDSVTSDLLLSFDVTIDFAGVIAADEDLVAVSGGGPSLFFDGSAAGLPESVDLDAVHHLDITGKLALSFDISGEVAGVFFDDEDVLEYAPISQNWELLFDASTEHAAWEAADLDGLYLLPEPNLVSGLAAGAALLTLLHRRRTRGAEGCAAAARWRSPRRD